MSTVIEKIREFMPRLFKNNGNNSGLSNEERAFIYAPELHRKPTSSLNGNDRNWFIQVTSVLIDIDSKDERIRDQSIGTVKNILKKSEIFSQFVLWIDTSDVSRLASKAFRWSEQSGFGIQYMDQDGETLRDYVWRDQSHYSESLSNIRSIFRHYTSSENNHIFTNISEMADLIDLDQTEPKTDIYLSKKFTTQLALQVFGAVPFRSEDEINRIIAFGATCQKIAPIVLSDAI